MLLPTDPPPALTQVTTRKDPLPQHQGKTLVLADMGPLAFFMNHRLKRAEGKDYYGRLCDQLARFLLAGGFFREYPWDTLFPRRSTHMVMCCDSPPYWRSKYVDQYKGTRPPRPMGVHTAVDSLTQAAHELGYPYLKYKGLEADDFMGSLVRAFHRGELEYDSLILWSVDTDLLQLVGDGVFWYNTSNQQPRFRGVRETLEWGKSRWGWDLSTPHEIAAMKSLEGDRSDNLPPGTPIWLIDLLGVPVEEAPEKIWETLDTGASLVQTVNRAGSLSSKVIREAFPLITLMDPNIWLSY